MVSVRVHNAVNDQAGADVFLWLLTVTDNGPSGDVYRAVNNLTDITYNGETYYAFPFELVLPEDSGMRPSTVQLSVPNVGRELMKMLRETLDPPSIKLELVVAPFNSNVVTDVEKSLDFLRISSAEYDAQNVTFTLSSTNVFARKTCSAIYNAEEFRSLFWAL